MKKLAYLFVFVLFTSPLSYAEDLVVRLYADSTFVQRWGQTGAVEKMLQIFTRTNNFYSDNFQFELLVAQPSIDINLFADPNNDPFVDRNSSQGGANRRLLDKMVANLPNTSPRRGYTYTNWLFVHKEVAGLAGEAYSIGGVGGDRAHMFISSYRPAAPTIVGAFIPPEVPPVCNGVPAGTRTTHEITMTAAHELGHLLSATHPSGTACASDYTLMCTPLPRGCPDNRVPQKFEFNSRNYLSVLRFGWSNLD